MQNRHLQKYLTKLINQDMRWVTYTFPASKHFRENLMIFVVIYARLTTKNTGITYHRAPRANQILLVKYHHVAASGN